GRPIDVRKLIQEAKRELKTAGKETITDDDIIKMCRHPLTTTMLDQIYRNTLITFDHIFALILEYCPTQKISIRALKAAIYVITREIIGLRIYRLHKSLNYDLYKLLINEPFEVFDSVFSLALEQDILTKESEDIYLINRETLNDEHDFYTIRIRNTLRVLLNEVALLEDLRECVKKEVNKPAHVVKKEAFFILYNRDEKFFSKDYKQFYSVFYSKPKEVGSPFILYDSSFTTGMVISHGYKAAPKEIRLLAEFVHSLKINVYAVRLKGHGTMPEDLREATADDWLDSFNRGIAAMRQISQKLLLCGFSMGGLLALILASRKEKHVDGIISINSALELNDIRINFIPTVNALNTFLSLMNADLDYIEDEPEHPDTNYGKHYVQSIAELKKVMDLCKESLPKIEAPILIIQGDNDPVVDPKSADLIFDHIKSKKKKKLYIPSSVHVIVRAPEREAVFAAVKDFVSLC
ncbi:MAG: alpha/beta fold hydrolase, partial [Thiovulaceae bacterium]|nr:alpha/beta fold hydrolase [Sulfurimonadaceae bacterium]